MTETADRPTVTATAGGITMTIDLHQMLTAIDPGGRWIGYDPENDEDRYEPSSFALHIADLTADRLAKAMRMEVKAKIDAAVQDVILAETTTLVRDALENGTLQRTNEWGRPEGVAKPLPQIILETAQDALTKPTGDAYSTRRPTVIQKMIADAVGAAFKKELTAEVEKVRVAARSAVEQSAAEVIRETVQRASRGL